MNNNKFKDTLLINLFTHIQTLMSQTDPKRAQRSFFVEWRARSCIEHTITPPLSDMISPIVKYRALEGRTESGYIVYISDRRAGCTCPDYQTSGGRNGPCKHMYSLMVLFVDWYIGKATGRLKYQLLIAYTDTETNLNSIYTALYDSKAEASAGLKTWVETTEHDFVILSHDIRAFYYGTEAPVVIWGSIQPSEAETGTLEPSEDTQIPSSKTDGKTGGVDNV